MGNFCSHYVFYWNGYSWNSSPPTKVLCERLAVAGSASFSPANASDVVLIKGFLVKFAVRKASACQRTHREGTSLWPVPKEKIGGCLCATQSVSHTDMGWACLPAPGGRGLAVCGLQQKVSGSRWEHRMGLILFLCIGEKEWGNSVPQRGEMMLCLCLGSSCVASVPCTGGRRSLCPTPTLSLSLHPAPGAGCLFQCPTLAADVSLHPVYTPDFGKGWLPPQPCTVLPRNSSLPLLFSVWHPLKDKNHQIISRLDGWLQVAWKLEHHNLPGLFPWPTR